eukprot:1159115-Pelagomonas_calceolata.AAC.11
MLTKIELLNSILNVVASVTSDVSKSKHCKAFIFSCIAALHTAPMQDQMVRRASKQTHPGESPAICVLPLCNPAKEGSITKAGDVPSLPKKVEQHSSIGQNSFRRAPLFKAYMEMR